MRRIIILALACLAVSGPAFSALKFNNGFINGNEWRGFAPSHKTTYIVGIVDALFYSVVYGASKVVIDGLVNCIQRKTPDQLTAVVEKFMKDNPELWDKAMSNITHMALEVMCFPPKSD